MIKNETNTRKVKNEVSKVHSGTGPQCQNTELDLIQKPCKNTSV